MRRVVDALMRERNPSRLVTLHGKPGVGKYSVGLAVARYVHERGYFKGGVLVLSGAEAQTWPPQALSETTDRKLLLLLSGQEVSSNVLARLMGEKLMEHQHKLSTLRLRLTAIGSMRRVSVAKSSTRAQTQ